MLGVQNLAQVHTKRLVTFLLCSGRVLIKSLRVLFKNQSPAASLAPMARLGIIVLDRSVGGQRVGWALLEWARSIKLLFCSVYTTQDSCPLSKTVAKRGKAPADELRP